MRWDASRPVPWRRLVKEWLIYAAIMTALFAFLYRDSDSFLPILGGLLVSGPLYLLMGYVLAKFGYVRKTLADLRTPRAGASPTPAGDDPVARPRPAPTRRTATGPNRPKTRRR
jgi:hypothetical protein